MDRRYQVVVLGALGHTGRFVTDELRRRGVRPLTAGRVGSGADRVVDFSDPVSLDHALAGGDAVLNCAGPFFDTAEPAALAAIRAGIPYLDVTAEQWTALRLFETLHQPAMERGVTIIPAMAFYGGLADLMATAIVGSRDSIDEVEIAMGLSSWHPTHGTRLTGARNTYARQIIRDGVLVPVPDPRPRRDWSFPDGFGDQQVMCTPVPEMVLLSRHLNIRSATPYMNLAPLADLADTSAPPLTASDKRGGVNQHFTVDVQATIGSERYRAVATGRDIYATSAPILVSACLELLSSGGKAGVQPPGAVFDARKFLAGLAPDVSVQFSQLEERVSA
jgi:Saccharopine dehydrogenase NADP binding domain